MKIKRREVKRECVQLTHYPWGDVYFDEEPIWLKDLMEDRRLVRDDSNQNFWRLYDGKDWQIVTPGNYIVYLVDYRDLYVLQHHEFDLLYEAEEE